MTNKKYIKLWNFRDNSVKAFIIINNSYKDWQIISIKVQKCREIKK